MVYAQIVSNWLVERAARQSNTLTPMQVLKLVYIAHGYSLGWRGVVLIPNKIEAWKYGPVIPDLYHAIKHWRDQPVGKVTVPFEPFDSDADDVGLVGAVYDAYKDMDGISLSNLTHQPGTPWAQVFKTNSHNLLIPNDLIQHYYRGILAPNG